jgi:hypothetical protein
MRFCAFPPQSFPGDGEAAMSMSMSILLLIVLLTVPIGLTVAALFDLDSGDNDASSVPVRIPSRHERRR